MDRNESRFDERYGALTPHTHWDGNTHYWTGMPVIGMDDQNCDNPNCCQNLDIYEGGEITPDPKLLESLRRQIKNSGKSHRALGTRLGMGMSRLRQRLYGKQPFSVAQFNCLCRLCGLNPSQMLSGGTREAAK